MCVRGPEIRISIKIPVFQIVCISSMYEKLKNGQSYEHLNITTGTHTVQTQIFASHLLLFRPYLYKPYEIWSSQV